MFRQRRIDRGCVLVAALALGVLPVRGQAPPPVVPPGSTPPVACDAPPVDLAFGFRSLRFDATWLPSGDGATRFVVSDFDLASTFAVPLQPGLSPLLLTPSLAAHAWEGPTSDLPGPGGAIRLLPGNRPDLPGSVYDAFLEAAWRERWLPWFFSDLAVAPGLSSDFRRFHEGSFRVRGRGLGIIALSEQLQFVGGVLYTGRNNAKVIPAGGVLWSPTPDVRLEAVFPQPKASYRLLARGDASLWGYVGGEFGGGAWAITRRDGRDDSVDYRDLRVLLGAEWVTPGGHKARAEVGAVLGRVIDYTSGPTDFKPESTLMLRLGVTY